VAAPHPQAREAEGEEQSGGGFGDWVEAVELDEVAAYACVTKTESGKRGQIRPERVHIGSFHDACVYEKMRGYVIG